ncbi:hypothetical protein QYS49_34990 [Marivirga salinae]|uniref:Uncharacterized protein n=1 Tax=Marivirga salinarum TaxID=3059078 RepID=A0AA51RC13_9BACT|nr:hypothetical protein [Marivirga sp. BDSF4-3]WMN12916.1 hypothetical protein QYS49_34990 [Marivirga sp. BDSF4-3]
MSPDSKFYTKSATNYNLGKGFVAPTTYPFNETTPESYMTVWPVGYPALIAIFSNLTGFNSFVSSKITNAFFLGLIFILLYYWFGEYSILPACYFCSFNQLEIYSYTWSEGVFLFFLLWLLYLLERNLAGKKSSVNLILSIICLASLPLLRYAGLIYFFYLATVVVILFLKKRYLVGKHISVVLFVSSILVFSYLLNNYFISGGFFSGRPRIFPEVESLSIFLKLLFTGIVNELFILRNFYWNWDPLFILMLLIQLIICYYIFRKKEHLDVDVLKGKKHILTISSSFFYLISIFVIRKLSPFDAFNYRILAPFSTPIFIVLLGNLRYKIERHKYNYFHILIVSFFILSLIMNLPKKFILSWLGVI